jgi:hypothetical protein
VIQKLKNEIELAIIMYHIEKTSKNSESKTKNAERNLRKREHKKVEERLNDRVKKCF